MSERRQRAVRPEARASNAKEDVQAKEGGAVRSRIVRSRWSWSGLKKSLSCCDAVTAQVVDHDHPWSISITPQCELHGRPPIHALLPAHPMRGSTLRIMARNRASLSEDPCSRSRRMVGGLPWPEKDHDPAGRVRHLMRAWSTCHLQKSRTTVAGDPSERYSLTCGLQGGSRKCIRLGITYIHLYARESFLSTRGCW